MLSFSLVILLAIWPSSKYNWFNVLLLVASKSVNFMLPCEVGCDMVMSHDPRKEELVGAGFGYRKWCLMNNCYRCWFLNEVSVPSRYKNSFPVHNLGIILLHHPINAKSTFSTCFAGGGALCDLLSFICHIKP